MRGHALPAVADTLQIWTRALKGSRTPAQARPEVQVVQRGGSITVADVQALVLWVLAEGQNPKWVFIKVSILCVWTEGPKPPVGRSQVQMLPAVTEA